LKHTYIFYTERNIVIIDIEKWLLSHLCPKFTNTNTKY
jgi:hypothetical protein